MIRPYRYLVLLGLIIASLHAVAQKEDWLPITPQDLAVKSVPGIPGAPAIQLYYADYIDDEDQTEFFYRRIKILNEKGYRYADVEITIPPQGDVSAAKARTIHPDGSVIEFTGKPLERVIAKGHGMRVLAKSFSLPDVTVNSIVEYKYKVEWPGVSLDNYWTIQHDLYTVKESFRMKPYGGVLEGFERGHQVAALFSHVPDNLKARKKDGGYQLEAENIPPFEAEGFMPPEDDYRLHIRFFYGGLEITSPEKFWQDAGRRWYEEAEHFIGSHTEISREAAQVIGEEMEDLQKLRKLYTRAQQVRNLSYEPERADEEQARENLKPDQNVLDVLARGYGTRQDITRFFVALARAAGFSASILRVSNRKEKFFDPELLSRRQLDNEIALIERNGDSLYLDPATRFCPFGFVRWMNTSSTALKLQKKGGTLVKVPSAPYDKAMTRRTGDLVLDAGGSLQGTVTVAYEGGEALERRLDALITDEAGRKKDLESELEAYLPSGAAVNLVNSNGWEDSDKPLVATFTVDIPSYAALAGKRLLVPGNLFQARQMEAFKRVDRKYPIYFPYAFGETDKITMQVPDGYTIENLPVPQSADIAYATYRNQTGFDGKQLVTRRVLQVNGIFFQLEIYPEIRDFFLKVQAGGEQQTVLQTRR